MNNRIWEQKNKFKVIYKKQNFASYIVNSHKSNFEVHFYFVYSLLDNISTGRAFCILFHLVAAWKCIEYLP